MQCKPAHSRRCRDCADTVQVTGIVWELELGSGVAVAKCVMLDTCAGISFGSDGGVVSEHANKNRVSNNGPDAFTVSSLVMSMVQIGCRSYARSPLL